MSRSLLAAACALVAVTLTACSGDDEKPDAGEEKSPTAAQSPHPEAPLPATVAQVVTPAHLDSLCRDGRFTQADEVLTTLPAEYAEQAERILTYDCGGRIDQVVWAEFAEPDVAAELLDPATAGGSVTFVAHTTVLAVNERLVNQGGLGALAYFEDLREQCGCGTYAEGSVTGGR